MTTHVPLRRADAPFSQASTDTLEYVMEGFAGPSAHNGSLGEGDAWGHSRGPALETGPELLAQSRHTSINST